MISIGLDVGGTKVLGVAVAPDGTVLAEQRRGTVDDPSALLDDLAALYLELVAAASTGREQSPSAGREPSSSTGREQSPSVDPAPPLGIGVPGLVDPAGTLVFSPNLAKVSGTDVRGGVSDRLASSRATVQVDNDATCAAAGESAFGAGRGRDDVLCVTLGTGIGGGIVSGGRLVRGSGNFAGEIGHVVVDPQGPPCGCGRRGCWERYASGSGLGRIARDHALAGRAEWIVALAGGDPDDVRGEHVITALNEGDGEAPVILEEFAWWLAVGLANLANILDPSVIVIGGGLVRAGEALLDPVRRAFLDQLEGAEERPPIEIVPAALGDRGGGIGAAVIGYEAAGTAVLGAREHIQPRTGV